MRIQEMIINYGSSWSLNKIICLYHRKYIKNSIENLHIHVRKKGSTIIVPSSRHQFSSMSITFPEFKLCEFGVKWIDSHYLSTWQCTDITMRNNFKVIRGSECFTGRNSIFFQLKARIPGSVRTESSSECEYISADLSEFR